MRQLAFWDTSALVPLCVPQVFSTRITTLINNYDAVVWWATPVEIAGALARLVRMKQIDLIERAKANRLAKSLADKWYVIDPSDTLLARATELVNRYDLRAADSLQLAAALEWCEDNPQGRILLTLDVRLRDAARLSGFDAQQI